MYAHNTHANHTHTHQAGGAAGVRANEVYFITLQPKDGLMMHCLPRGGPDDTDPLSSAAAVPVPAHAA